jgi:hypothetical protein
MKAEITYNPQTQTYLWELWDGPDGIDYVNGTELDLSQCFERILEFRVMNSLAYLDDPRDGVRDFFSKQTTNQ